MTKVAAQKKVEHFPAPLPYDPATAAEFLDHHEQFVAANPAPDWIQSLRRAGAAALAARGLPSPKLERWKYTNLPAAVRGQGGDMSGSDVSFVDPCNVVRWLADVYKDVPDWLRAWQEVAPAGEDKYQDMMLWHMANAFLRDGLLIDVPANYAVKQPLEIIITGHDGGFFVPRTAIRLGGGAELTLIEHHQGAGKFWNNRLTQIVVGPNAKLHHYRVQDYGTDAVYTQTCHVRVERDATYEGFTLTQGARLSRNSVHVELTGINGTTSLYGLNLLRGSQLGDTTITIEHQAPHCVSNQFFRTVLDDQARGVYQGKVHVHKEAQKTDGYQLSNALILSEGAEMDTKPELEIYADDVKCSHGATTGQLDKDALFYMRARGLDEAAARHLLIGAFAREAVEKLADQGIADELMTRIEGWLDASRSTS